MIRTTTSWLAAFPHVTTLLEMSADSRVWVPGPPSSTMNLFAAVHAHAVGAQVVESVEGATHAHLTPSALRDALPHRLLAGVHVVVAGDRLTRALHDEAARAGVRVSHYYGAAELSFVAWGSHEEDLTPFPEVEVEVRSSELWVRSPYLCEGYDGAPGPLRFDDDGFATVGDRGALVDGRVVVTGRGSEAVTSGGATVQVADVEHVLRRAVAGDVHVVGVPHPDLGQVVAAVLTESLSLPAARAASRSSLTAAQRPRLWCELRTPPLTASGKVDRAALAELVTAMGPDVRRLR